MRGEYQVTHEDRRRFFHALLELCQSQVDKVDLVSTQLCLCNCIDLLEELGYEQYEWETKFGVNTPMQRPLLSVFRPTHMLAVWMYSGQQLTTKRKSKSKLSKI